MRLLNKLLTMLIFASMASIVTAQTNYKVYGTVTNQKTSIPVQGQQVYVIGTDGYDTTRVITDQNGFYIAEYEPADSLDALVITADPCSGELLYMIVPPYNSSYEANFTVCSDTMVSCQALFTYYNDVNMYSEDSMYHYVYFTDISNGNPDSWLWNFGDGSFSSERYPAHNYLNEGVYYVSLTISSTTCTSTIIDSIIIGAQPISCNVNFSYELISDTIFSNDTIYLFDSINTTTYSVNFIDYTYPEAKYWNWDFGDGYTSNEQNPVHTYAAAGEYIVSLESRSDSCSGLARNNIIIGYPWERDSICNAYFSYYSVDNLIDDSINQPYGYAYYFDNLSTGNTDSILWDFGDGIYSEDFSQFHSYDSPGEYMVTLYLLGECNSMYSQWINVGATDTIYKPDTCMAIFYNKVSGKQVSFVNESLGEIQEWNWDFGDGNTSYEKNPVHQYQSTGLYEVTLTAYSHDCSSTFISEVMVGTYHDSTELNAFFIPHIKNSTVNFNNQSVGKIKNYHWDFGDGSTSKKANVKHTYDQLGTYIVTLGIANNKELTTYTLEINLNTGTIKGIVQNPSGIGDSKASFSELNIYPNPIDNNASISIKSDINETATISIMNTSGQIVFTELVNITNGLNKIEINTSPIKKGFYILQLITETNMQSIKIIK